MENDKDNLKELDDVDLARRVNERLGLEDAQTGTSYKNELLNLSLTQTDVHMFGDCVVLAQIVQLLSYIRHAVRNNMKTEIVLSFGNELANAEFNFDANGFVVPDLIPKEKVQIN